MTYHISSAVRSCFFHLCSLGKQRQYLNRKTANAFAVSLVLSRLDYCNSCLRGMPKNQLLRLQLVQNTAATVVTQTKRSDHITLILRELHWLPVEMCINYKILSLVYSCMNGTAPDYFRKLISCYLPVRHLRFSTQSRLRISDVDQGNNNNNKNTLESEYLPMLHPNCGTVCTLP